MVPKKGIKKTRYYFKRINKLNFCPQEKFQLRIYHVSASLAQIKSDIHYIVFIFPLMGCHYPPQKSELEEKDQSAFFFSRRRIFPFLHKNNNNWVSYENIKVVDFICVLVSPEIQHEPLNWFTYWTNGLHKRNQLRMASEMPKHVLFKC